MGLISRVSSRTYRFSEDLIKMPKRKTAIEDSFSFNECLEILATEGIDSENIPDQLKGWVLVTALQKSSQHVHDKVFNDLHNHLSKTKKKVEIIYDEEPETSESEAEEKEKGKGWTPSKHYSGKGKSKKKDRKPGSGRKPKDGISAVKYQKIPKHLQKKRGRPLWTAAAMFR